MKVFGFFLIITVVALIAMKMIAYFRYIKLHQRQVAQMEELLLELRAKQRALNKRVHILTTSEEFHRNRLNTIYFNVFETVDKFFTIHS